jgi:general stress protein YciG
MNMVVTLSRLDRRVPTFARPRGFLGHATGHGIRHAEPAAAAGVHLGEPDARCWLSGGWRKRMANDQSKKQDSGHASAEGKKGVSQETVGSGKEHDPNNFANDPSRAAEAGRKGGQQSRKDE